MFELIMTICLAGQECAAETVANFPQYDVGQQICELAKPGIERGVRARLPAGSRATFVCTPSTGGDQEEFQYERKQQEPSIQNEIMQQLPGLINQFRNYSR